MKLKQMISVVAIAAMFSATAAFACPNKDSKTAKSNSPCSAKHAQTVADKAPCSKNAKMAETVSNDGRSEEKPCCSGMKKAHEGDCGPDCPCHHGAKLTADKAPCTKSAEHAEEGGCPIEKKVKAVLASLPAMKYRVGDKTIGCPKSAAAMAEESHQTMEYVVGDEATTDKTEAIVKLTKMLDDTLADMQAVQYVVGEHCGRCPMTAKSMAQKEGKQIAYRVGGVDFKNKEDAERVAKLVSDAIGEVAMSYKVEGKTYHCNKTAGEKCKKSGAKLTYVVGDEETCCEKTAKMHLAEAKIRKAVETAAAALMSL